ncbi:MAG: potassium channel protein [Deltaproteobacteria bacterium]|nr:MAG: potassium channel protein [Deltaproteobacteria bacterium]
MAGSTGYYLLFGGKPRFMDCVYMTVVSLTTVGYGEVIEITGNIPAQIFTMILIIFGMGIILYGISTATAIIVEGELTGILRKKRMLKEIQKLKNHIIVCGGGETGRPVLTELVKNKEPVVLIEQEEENIERCKPVENLLYILGDATDDENLLAAGIEKASGIIITLPTDKDNLYLTMTARILNNRIRIVSRMIDQKLEPKLKMAGADRVVSPNTIGALRMASEMIRPTVVDFLDSMLRSSRGNLRIHQITVSENSGLAGKQLNESGIKDKFDLLVLGAKHEKEDIKFNPSPLETLDVGMTLIVMGEVENIARARKAF